jgi:lysophospholipase L1-like esterase
MVIDNYRDLLDLINRFNIADEIYCLSINPSRAFFASLDKRTAFNRRLKSLTGEYNDVEFTDFSELFFKDGKLKEELISKDGIHLSHDGYELWTEYFSKKVGIL